MGLSETVVAFLEGDAIRCDLDASGNPREWSVGEDAPAVVIIVTTATDALKTSHAGLVSGALDRSEVWEIAGVSLHRDSVSNFDGVGSVADWVETLRAAGVDLVAIESDAL